MIRLLRAYRSDEQLATFLVDLHRCLSTATHRESMGGGYGDVRKQQLWLALCGRCKVQQHRCLDGMESSDDCIPALDIWDVGGLATRNDEGTEGLTRYH